MQLKFVDDTNLGVVVNCDPVLQQAYDSDSLEWWSKINKVKFSKKQVQKLYILEEGK